MPWGDRTGPLGEGPMTGRGAGFCAGYSVPGYANPVGGRGYWGAGRGRFWGAGFGRGFKWGWRGGFGWGLPYAVPYPPQVAPADEAQMLKNEAKALEEEIKVINERIKTLEAQADKEKKK